VLRALGRSDELAHSSLRMTIGRWTTEEEIDYAIATIRQNVAKLRELSPLWEMYQDGVDSAPSSGLRIERRRGLPCNASRPFKKSPWLILKKC
jgi:hypothetical protein